MSGTLYALGLGPGDPDLLTLRARALLQRVPTLFAPVRRAGERSYAAELVEPLVDTHRQRLEVLPFPTQTSGWRPHVDRMVAALEAGDAAFMTEGDPLFYSTFIDVLDILRAAHPSVPVCVVPGVASPMAAAAAVAWPLADGAQRLAVLPAMHALESLPETLERFDTVVLLKVAPVLPAVLDQVDAAGLGERAVHVRRVGRPEQAVCIGSSAIRSAPEEVTADYFSLLIVHRSARGGAQSP